jgi:peptidylprolyl isomerase
MATATTGDTVKVHYTGKLEDGTVFDTSRDRDPLEFTLGQQQVIPGFENAVTGMNVGEAKTTNIPVDDAYGQRREDLLFGVSPDQFPEDMAPKVGDQLRVQLSNGQAANVVVFEIKDDAVVLDANHPLAGQNLVFDIELVEVA